MYISKPSSLIIRVLFSLCVVVGIGVLLAPAAPTFGAEVPTEHGAGRPDAPGKRTEFQNIMQERRENYDMAQGRGSTTSEFNRERMLEKRAKFGEAVKNRVKNLLSNITSRIEAVLNRLDTIADRIEVRIEKLEDMGAEGDDARGHLESARDALAHARQTLEGVDETEVDTVVDSQAPHERFQGMRGTIESIRTDLQTVQKELRESVTALKEAARGIEGRGVSEAVANEHSASSTPKDESESATENEEESESSN